MKFELRKLQATDLFLMVKIINKVGIDNIKNAINFDEINRVKEKLNGENSDAMISELGVNVVMSVLTVLFERLPLIETELYHFVGSIANMKDKEVAKLEINDFMALVIAILKKEEFKDFFKQALQLIK